MRNILKKSLIIVLSVAMTFSFVMPAKTNADSYTDTFEVSTVEELTAAAEAVNSGSGHYLIKLTDDIEGLGAGAGFSKNTVTILGQGHYIKNVAAEHIEATAINAYGTAVVNLGLADGSDTLIIKGRKTNDVAGGIYVQTGATVTMNDGVTIKDFEGQNYFGGGVTVEGGTFTMNGGTIDKCGIKDGSVCFGGGVAVFRGGIFTMNGGTISNCYVDSDYIDDYDPNRCFTAQGGGVYVTEGSTFTMNGGTISKCSATNFGGGIAIDLSEGERANFGFGNIKSKFVLNGGTVSENEATAGAGIFASGYFYSYAAQLGTYHPGIGTPSDPGIYVNGGTITKNKTTGDDGGGVYIAMLRASLPVRICNATISDNEGYSGGGIMNFGYWTQMLIEGCTITGNSSTSNGGGVAASSNSSNGYTTVKDCIITDNTSGAIGAGVYYDASSAMRISGANTIQDNTYNGKANNLNILNSSKLVSVIGDLTGSQIGLSDPTLWGDNKTDDDATASSTAALTTGYSTYNSVNPENLFTSDHETWFPDFNNNGAGPEVRLVRKSSAFKGGNLTLGSDSSLNVWLYLEHPDNLKDGRINNFSVKFTQHDTTQEGKIVDVDAIDDADHYIDYQGSRFYKFKLPIDATQLVDEVDAEVYYMGETTGVKLAQPYSAKKYANNMLDSASTRQELKDLLPPLLNYGAYSQKYFQYKKNDLANEGHTMDDEVAAESIGDEQKIITQGDLPGIDQTSFSLTIDSAIKLEFDIRLAEGQRIEDYHATLEGKNGEKIFVDENGNKFNKANLPFTSSKTGGGLYHIIINKIPANRYDNKMILTLSSDGSEYTADFSVFSYGYKILYEGAAKDMDLPEGATEADLQSLIKSMVLYNEQANTYFANNLNIEP